MEPYILLFLISFSFIVGRMSGAVQGGRKEVKGVTGTGRANVNENTVEAVAVSKFSIANEPSSPCIFNGVAHNTPLTCQNATGQGRLPNG